MFGVGAKVSDKQVTMHEARRTRLTRLLLFTDKEGTSALLATPPIGSRTDNLGEHLWEKEDGELQQA
jgi:hypothetical protein